MSNILLRLTYYAMEVGFQLAFAHFITLVYSPILRWLHGMPNTHIVPWFLAIYATTLALSLTQYFVIATLVDLLADYVFPDSIRLAAHKRSKQLADGEARKDQWGAPYDYGHRGYLVNHMLFSLRWCVPMSIAAVMWIPRLMLDENPPLWQIPLKVQCGLVFGDLAYWLVHISQHKCKALYQWSDHSYHHQFRHPWGSAGTWLGTVDLLVATFAIGSFNIYCTELIFGRLSLFEYMLMINFVHEMNCVDHSGCEFPFWSGCPFFPPLGYWLRLDKSIAMHEAHHNYNHYSYGLLGFADQFFGTAKYPPGYPLADRPSYRLTQIFDKPLHAVCASIRL